ncbi:hypothetical protein GE09DRAFT_1084154 [Coniochaeta sp. 2T2.1]|nr:hypothetical protein GE09DRAFT_1084154 [Coniochaeta sp. 2T2.1]
MSLFLVVDLIYTTALFNLTASSCCDIQHGLNALLDFGARQGPPASWFSSALRRTPPYLCQGIKYSSCFSFRSRAGGVVMRVLPSFLWFVSPDIGSISPDVGSISPAAIGILLDS